MIKKSFLTKSVNADFCVIISIGEISLITLVMLLMLKETHIKAAFFWGETPLVSDSECKYITFTTKLV